MKSIVTGGCGFIGSHLVDLLLLKGHEVIVIDNFSTGRKSTLDSHKENKNLKIHELDITKLSDEDKRLFLDVDYVFHLAALADIVPSVENPEIYFETNVKGTLNVLNASLKNKRLKKLVYSASSSCYGIPDNYPTLENSEIRPEYPYALTKRMGEELVLHWGKLYKLPINSLRLFNVYGPRSRTNGTYGAVFGVFLAQKLANKPFTVIGDGNQSRDFVFVTDVANAFFYAAVSEKNDEIFNVGSGETNSINKLVELLNGEVVHIPKRPGEPEQTFANIEKIKEELNWEPKIGFEEGVGEVLKSIDYWKEAPVWTPESIGEETKSWFKAFEKN